MHKHRFKKADEKKNIVKADKQKGPTVEYIFPFRFSCYSSTFYKNKHYITKYYQTDDSDFEAISIKIQCGYFNKIFWLKIMG